MATGSETTLDLRLPSALKEAVAVAAAHLGQTVDEFAVGVLAKPPVRSSSILVRLHSQNEIGNVSSRLSLTSSPSRNPP